MNAQVKASESSIRPMSDADLDRVVVIERGAYEFPWSPGVFRDCLRVGYDCWVLERPSGIDGYGIMHVAVGEAHVLNLCIDVAAQGRGLGRALLGRLVELAEGARARTVLLEVRPSNYRARRLYAGMGFNEIGVRRGYYPGRQGREDALVLVRRLSGPERG
ncbi:MAG: ribosomal protein S18-alanine N-acetyltransferase [Chromatiales bacterium]|nr:ribosomal protein S18-alanine N-acetyltransferase [Chromatiales bacterium]